LIAKGAKQIVLAGGVSDVIKPYLPKTLPTYYANPKVTHAAGDIEAKETD